MLRNLFFDESDIRAIKEATDPKMVAMRDEMLKETGTGSLVQMGLLWHLSGDDQYVRRARDMMYSRVNDGLWISGGYDPDRYEGYDLRTSLETADQCEAMANGLGIFGNALSEEDRNFLIQKTWEKGILPTLEDWVLPGKRTNALDTMGHNFWSAIVSSAALALTVLRDELPEGEKMLQLAAQACEAWFKYPGNPMNAKPMTWDNGGYYESVGYFDYAYGSYLKFACAYKRLTGRPPFEDDMVYIEGGKRFLLNNSYWSDRKDYGTGFGDCGPDNSFRSVSLHMIRYGLDAPDLRWYVRTRLCQNGDKPLRLFIWNDLYGKEAQPPKELSACFDGIGWATFRDSWEQNATMLAVKCGDTWNHAHADAGHFILFRKGSPEIYDSMVKNYSDPLYIQFFVESKAHNVTLFEGKGQDFRDNYKNHVHLPGKLLNYRDEKWFRYVCADATGPMSRWFRKEHRHFLWLDSFILIYDDIESYENGEVNFLLHAKENNCFRMLSPHTTQEKTGYNPKDYSERKYLSFNTHTDDEGHAKFAAVMLLDESLDVRFEELKLAWKITAGDTVVYINRRADGKVAHRNCVNNFDGIMTDAEIVVLKNGEYGAVNASFIRRDGKSILESLARVTGLVK